MAGHGMRPGRVVLGAAGSLVALSLGVGALTGPAVAQSETGVSLSGVMCSDAARAGSAHLALLSDAVPADIGSRICELTSALG